MAYKQKGWSPFTKQPPKRNEDTSVMSADQMRHYREMTDHLFDEKAKNFEYTPQIEKRRLIVDLKPQTVVDKEKDQRKIKNNG